MKNAENDTELQREHLWKEQKENVRDSIMQLNNSSNPENSRIVQFLLKEYVALVLILRVFSLLSTSSFSTS